MSVLESNFRQPRLVLLRGNVYAAKTTTPSNLDFGENSQMCQNVAYRTYSYPNHICQNMSLNSLKLKVGISYISNRRINSRIVNSGHFVILNLLDIIKQYKLCLI